MQTRWLVVVFAGLLSNEPECVAGDTTARELHRCSSSNLREDAHVELYSDMDVDLLAVHQHVCPVWFFCCTPAYLQISASRGENMLVANLEIIEEEGNVV